LSKDAGKKEIEMIKPKRSLSKTFTSTFKLGYSEEEARAAPQFDCKLIGKFNIETKHEPRTVLGISKFCFINDSKFHKRGRASNYSNERTYGSNIRYLPGSKIDDNDIYIPSTSIKLSKLTSS
jgi:hypothetical protein